MSLKVCTAESMISDVKGINVARSWLPRPVMEQFLQATKDGEVKLSPDPVITINGDMSWFNNTGLAQSITVLVHRAPRNILAQSPSTVTITDAWTHQVGSQPTADFPSVSQDTFGGRFQIDRPSADPANLRYGRFFLYGDDSQVYVPVGVVPPRKMFQFRYIAGIQTPGTWISPAGSFAARWEAFAYWTRLVALASPAPAQGY